MVKISIDDALKLFSEGHIIYIITRAGDQIRVWDTSEIVPPYNFYKPKHGI